MKRIDLVTAIKAVMLGVDKSSAIGTDFLLFDENWVRSFKEDICVSYPLVTGIRTAVKAEELYKIISKLDSEDVTIELGQGAGPDKLFIESGRTKIKMNPLQKDQITHSLERAWAVQTDDLEFFYLPKKFQEGLELCSFSAGTGAAKGAISGVHFTGNLIIATDNYRVSIYTMDAEVPSSFTVPTKVVESILRLGENFETISLSKGWVHFCNIDGAIFSSRLLTGEFPVKKATGLLKSMEFDLGQIPFEFPKGLEAPLDRAKILASGESDMWEDMVQVSIKYSDGNLVISASKEVGEITELIPWEKDHIGEGLELKVQPDFFKKVLAITRHFQLSPTKKSVLFSSDKFHHIMVATLSK